VAGDELTDLRRRRTKSDLIGKNRRSYPRLFGKGTVEMFASHVVVRKVETNFQCPWSKLVTYLTFPRERIQEFEDYFIMRLDKVEFEYTTSRGKGIEIYSFDLGHYKISAAFDYHERPSNREAKEIITASWL
jgi:hypothetical protein